MSASSTQVLPLGWQGSSSGGSSGAPADATYITQTPNSTLTNEQALSLLSTGLMKVTTSTGVVSVAVAGTDYVAPATTITAGTGLTGGGDLSTNRTISMPATGPGAGTIGTAGITTLTLDAQGRVTAATSAALVAQTIQVIAGTGLSGGGALSANVTLSLPNTGPGAGTIGTAGIATITLDAQGRVTAATTATFLTTAAPVNAQYLTLATDSTLTVERVFTPSTGLTAVDGGAGSTYTLTANLSVGVSGGQSAVGGTAASNNLTLSSTSNGTKGFVVVGTTTTIIFDETNSRIGLGTATPESGFKIGNTSLGLSALFGASSLPSLIATQSAAGTFPGFVTGNDSTHQLRLYWQDSSAEISTVGGQLDISPATALTFYSTTGGRVSSDGSWSVGNIGANGVSKLRFVGTRTLATATSLAWDSADFTASTLTLTGTNAVTTATGLNFLNISAPTYTDASVVTVTNAATVYVSNAPQAAGSVTITNAYALWVDNGAVRLDGNVGFFATAPAAQQTSGANLTNSVTTGGTNDTIADFTSLTVYASDAATIRNDIFQLARKLKQINDGLRTFGLFT